MASSFLKKKAQERREIINKTWGTDTEQKTSSGNHAAGSDLPAKESGKASDFLRKKAQERRGVIDREYGVDAYGGSNAPTTVQNSTTANEPRTSYLDAARNATKATIDSGTSALSAQEKERRRNELNAELDELDRRASLNRKKQVGYLRGNVTNLLRDAEKEGAEISARISEINKELERLDKPDTITYTEQLGDELTAAKERQRKAQNAVAKYSGEAGGRALAALPKEQREALYNELNVANAAAAAVEREREQIEYLNKYQDKVYDDTFTGQFGANYRQGHIAQDTSAAFAAYLSNPTEANKNYAYALQELEQRFRSNNQSALDDEGAVLPWLTQSAAGYLPQLDDQIKFSVAGGGTGALLGSLVGQPIKGAEVGITLAMGAQSYNQMKGAAYRALISAGMDEESALEAAQDEAFISALIEMGDTAFTLLTLGGGTALNALGNAAIKSGSKNAIVKGIAGTFSKAATNKAAKAAASWAGKPLGQKALRVGGGLALNAMQEYGEEWTQEMVSSANQSREGTGKWDLATETVGLAKDALTGKNDEALARAHEAGTEGFKIGLMFGGTQAGLNAVVSNWANAKTDKARSEVVDEIMGDRELLDSLVDGSMEMGAGTVSESLAIEMRDKLDANGAVTRRDVESLLAANDVYIKENGMTATIDSEQDTDPILEAARETVGVEPVAGPVEQNTSETAPGRVWVIGSNPAYDTLMQEQAQAMLDDIKGSKGLNGRAPRTTADIASLLEQGYSVQDIKDYLRDIVQDNPFFEGDYSGAIETALSNRLLNGYQDIHGTQHAPNAEFAQLQSGMTEQADVTHNAVSDPLVEAAREAVGADTISGDAVQGVSEVSHENDTQPIQSENAVEVARNARQAPPMTVERWTGYGEHGTKTFTEIVEEMNADPMKVRQSFQPAYEAGLANAPRDRINLLDVVQAQAYNAGLRDKLVLDAKDSKGGNATVRKDAGFVYDTLPADVTPMQAKAVDMLAKATGVRVQIAKGLKGNAEIRDDGTVLIDEDFEREVGGKKRSIVFYAAHEIGMHRLMQLAPKEGRAFISAIISGKNKGLPYGAMTDTEAKQAAYAQQNVSLSIEKAMEEVSADEVLGLYDSEEDFFAAIDRIMNGTDEQAKKGARKFKEILDDIIRKLKQIVAKLTGKERVQAQETLDEVMSLRDLYERALAAAADRAKNGKVANKSGRAENSRGTMDYSLKEDLKNGKARKETRADFLRRADGEGYRIYEGKTAAYGYRNVRWQSAEENARQVQEEIKKLGIEAVIIDDSILWNRDGITGATTVEEAITVERSRIFINNSTTLPPRNVAGHEAFHLWKNGVGRDALIETVTENLLFSSETFRGYQSAIAEEYFGGEADLSDPKQEAKLMEELFAYICGDIHEGVNDDLLRPMFRDFDAVKAAWNRLVEQNAGKQSRLKSPAVEVGNEGASFEENGVQYSIKSLRHDITEGRMFDDLVRAKVFSQKEADLLKANLDKLISYMLPHANILDMNESYTKDNRPYKAYKPNSDPLYVISLDFSTLCRKRLMTQYVIEQLQLRENRPMSAEEQMAIRSMLLEYRQQEKALQVACAMCYVEAARLKAPKQMERFFIDTESIMRKYFAKKDSGFNATVVEAQKKFKRDHGYDENAPKKDMKAKDVAALNKMSARMRTGYTPNAEQQAIIDTAVKLPRSTFLTAANLTALAIDHPEIYNAYTDHIRASTRSKSLEGDIPYYYGDSRGEVSDKFIDSVNAENGMRFDSWSDFQMKHMLDMITAVVDLSVRKSKMHGYTKFPEMVRIFGKTGMMFNLSGVADGNGFDADGNLLFSDTESIDFDEAIKLRKAFPETAGLQCIGVSDDHIRALLRSDYIDYVIPYHTSGLNAALRRMAGIYEWQDYTKTQHARKDPNAKKPANAENWQVEPVWSEFFVSEGKDGYDVMQNTAKRYVEMCRERGLIPKFDQFLDEDGYWKLLVDRKMVNQETGTLIEQKAVKPIFDFDLIQQEIDREVSQYDPGLEQRALKYVVDNFDAVTQRIRDLKKRHPKKAMLNMGNEVFQAYAEGSKRSEGTQYSLKDSEGKTLTREQAEYFKDSKVRDKNGSLLVVYHATDNHDFFEFKIGDVGFHFGTYEQAMDRVYGDHSARMIEAYLNITNPIHATMDYGDWGGKNVASMLIECEEFELHPDRESIEHTLQEIAWMDNEYEADDALREFLQSLGYDGFVYPNRFEGEDHDAESYIAFDSNQIKLTGNKTPTDHPDIRYSIKGERDIRKEIERIRKEGEKAGKTEEEIEAEVTDAVWPQYQEMIKTYGAIKRGERPAREIEVPKKTEEDRRVSQTIRTVLEAEATPDAAIPTIQQLITQGDFSYDVITDKAAMDAAKKSIRAKGYETSLAEWLIDMRAGKVSKAGTALGWELYNQAANAGDLKTAMTILDGMVKHQRNAAQALQATRILKKLSPDAQLYSVVRSVRGLEEDINEGRKPKKGNSKRAAEEVGEAKKDASDAAKNAHKSVRGKRKNGGVVIDSNQAGEPFVFEYAQKVGEAVAKGLEAGQNREVKERTFLQQIAAQIKRFAEEKMPKQKGKKALTAIDLLRDYIQNQAFYADAWQYAQEELREKYADDPAFSEFLNTGIGVDANVDPRNAIFMRALVKAAADSGEGKAILRKQSALGFTGMSNTIADNLIRQTGAKGEMADTIRDAAHAYVFDVLKEEGKADADIINSSIRSAMSDIGAKISNVVMSGTRESAQQAIVEKLVGKYGFGLTEATNTAEIVADRFEQMCREFSQRRLESMFKERNVSRKTIPEKIEQLARLGAFDVGSAYNQKAAERIFQEGVTLTVNEELARKFLQAKTQEERDNILADIYRDIGRQMPSTFMDKWNAWGYLAMLGNPRTHVRNIIGNAGFAPVVLAKDMTAMGVEAAVSFVSGGKIERTKAMPSRELLKAAWEDYANVADDVTANGKYSDAAVKNRHIEEGRRIFGRAEDAKTSVGRLVSNTLGKGAELARRKNSEALEAEDQWFAQPHYAFALAQYCKAHGVTADQLRRGKALGNARAYAIKEAQKATYRDANQFSELISSLGRYQGDNMFRKGFSVVVEGILPFRKTPANILVRGIEYSPIGLLKSITWDLAKVKSGDITAAEMIDNFSAGFTGTMLLGTGVWLAAEGLIRGAGGDDEDEKKFDELQGHQAYSLELPNGASVTLDWLAPEVLPLFIGVNLYEMARDNKGKSNLSDILTAVSNVTEPLLEMSCLQSLNDLFDSVGYASTNGLSALPSALASAATSYLTRAFPTILGQAERSGQDVRMTTYTEKNGFLTSDMQYTLGKISARLPGWDFQQIPYVDAWGRTESTGNPVGNAANNFLNPAYTSQIETSAMERELERLYDATGESSVLPSRADKYFNVDKERKDLTAEEYVKYATEKGQLSYKVVTALTQSAEYKNMADFERVEAIGYAYAYANAVAKTKVSKYAPEGWIAKAIATNKKTGLSPERYIPLYMKQKDIESLRDADGNPISNSSGLQVMELVYKTSGLTSEQRHALFADFGVGKSIIHYNSALVEQKLKKMRK